MSKTVQKVNTAVNDGVRKIAGLSIFQEEKVRL